MRRVGGRRLRLFGVLAVIAGLVFWGAGAEAGVVRPAPPTGPPTVPHNRDLDSLRKRAFGRPFTIDYSETDSSGGTDRVTGSGKLTISLVAPATSSTPRK